MKAAVVVGKGRIEIEDIPKPEVKPGSLLLKVLYCSICGSEVERLYSPFWDIASQHQLALIKGAILGHEYVAAVEEVGPGVIGWKVGDRVVDIHISCGNCFYCRRGMNELCLGGRVRGYPYDGTPSPVPGPPRWGAMTEYLVRPADTRLRVPIEVSDQEATFTEPLGTGVTATLNAGVKIGDSVLVIGVGHIGLMVLAAAKAAGASPLIAVDKKQERLEVAKQMGANIIINASKVDPTQEVVKITEAGPDIVFVCASFSAKDVLQDAFEMVRYHGRVIIVGSTAPSIIDTGKWLNKEVRVEGTVHMGEGNFTAMRLMQYKRIDVRPTITEIIPLSEAQRAFESLLKGTNIAVLLKP